MPERETQKRITARGQTPGLQSDKGDRIGVATAPTQALGDLYGGSVISKPMTSDISAWSNVSSTLGDVIRSVGTIHSKIEAEKERARAKAEREAEKAQAKAERDAERAQNKAERDAERAQDKAEREEERQRQQAEKEAEKRDKLEEAKRESLLSIEGVNRGAALKAEALEKVKSGEWTPDDVAEKMRSEIGSLSPEDSALWKAAKPDIDSAIKEAYGVYYNRTTAEANGMIADGIQQGFHNALEAYDPDSPDDYIQKRTTLFQSKDGAGITGAAFNEMEMEALSNQVYKYALSDPLKAMAFIDLAEKERPDGSPGLAASASDGYGKTAKLREYVAERTVKGAEREGKEAKELRKESTKENYVKALSEMGGLESPEDVANWAKDNWDSVDVSHRLALYGDYAVNLAEKLAKRQASTTTTQKHPDNEKAYGSWSIAITRGTAEWDAIEEDQRLTETQKAKLFREMTKNQQDEKAGFLSTASLGGMLLDKVETGWDSSIYKTPYKASARPAPGKPHVVDSEGVFYLNEYQKRINQLDPVSDPQASNKARLEILEETVSDIHSGKIRYASVAPSPAEVPELKPSQKVAEGVPLTEPEIQTAARVLNEQGAKGVREAIGLDLLTLIPAERDRIMAKAQQMKAELDALKANSWFARLSKWRNSPESEEGIVDTLEMQLQHDQEAMRLVWEGMELDRKLMMGEPINNE